MKVVLRQCLLKGLGIAALAAMVSLYAGTQALAQSSVGVSVSIQQPGVYGRVDIGNYPSAPLVYPQPVVIRPTPIAIHRQPIYLYIPTNHQRRWDRYCGHYNACGQPVYFVQERWVQAPHRDFRGHESDHGRKRGHGGDKKYRMRHDD